MTLVDEKGETILTLRSSPVNATAAERERFRAWHFSMQNGFNGSFEQLEAYLAQQS